MLTTIDGLRLGRGGNDRQHWRAKARTKKAEREAVAWQFRMVSAPKITPICVVTITRIAPGNGLDDDNLAGACKHVRDEIAHWLGVDDKRSDIVRYAYAQARGPWSVRIEVAE